MRRGAKFDFSRSGNSAVLIVKDSEPSDAATYRCEAVNKIGRVDTQARLKVHSKLSTHIFPFNLTFVCNEIEEVYYVGKLVI